MRAVTKYVSEDGLEFTDEQKCIGYEALCKEVAEIMSKLHPIPALPSCQFENGAGYIQHDPDAALAVRNALLRVANTIFPHQWFDQAIADPKVHSSYPGRLISEMSEKCVYQAWHRFSCMDAGFREWGQPYFANNPGSASDVCLNGSTA